MKIFIKILVVSVLVFIFYSEAYSEETGWDGMPLKESNRVIKKEDGLRKNWHFIVATIAAFAFTTGDIEYSLHNINSHGAREGNPWAKDFFDGGKRGKAYAYGYGLTGVTMGVSYLFFRAKDPDTQKLWVVFPAIVIVGHGVGIGLNLAF